MMLELTGRRFWAELENYEKALEEFVAKFEKDVLYVDMPKDIAAKMAEDTRF